ncbi:MAG: hypothetical protein EAZ91_11465 [Cytophagales bacterium]|nr:MAG: hypothetical protein EAZ91_11465 [Cytophagales bacterium]
MKRLTASLLVCLLTTFAASTVWANISGDSLVIQFANRTRMVIYAPDKEGIKKLSRYDLNKIVREMGMKLDSVPNGQTTISIDSQNGDRYLRDTVLVIRTNREGNGRSIRITYKGDEKDKRDTNQTVREYSTERLQRKRSSKNDWKVKTDFLIGLNTLITQSETPPYNADSYALRPIGSRFFGISFSQRPTLARGKNARLSLHYGLEINWNNFMFDNDVTVRRATTLQFPERVEFVPIQDKSEKSKLTIANLQLPVVPRVTFYNNDGRRVAHLGIGGFVGYRVDSYTMIKYGRGNKERDHDRFFQNDLRYGLMAHIGIGRTSFFAKYDLNPIFMLGQGPDLRALSFGISL